MFAGKFYKVSHTKDRSIHENYDENFMLDDLNQNINNIQNRI